METLIDPLNYPEKPLSHRELFLWSLREFVRLFPKILLPHGLINVGFGSVAYLLFRLIGGEDMRSILFVLAVDIDLVAMQRGSMKNKITKSPHKKNKPLKSVFENIVLILLSPILVFFYEKSQWIELSVVAIVGGILGVWVPLYSILLEGYTKDWVEAAKQASKEMRSIFVGSFFYMYLAPLILVGIPMAMLWVHPKIRANTGILFTLLVFWVVLLVFRQWLYLLSRLYYHNRVLQRTG